MKKEEISDVPNVEREGWEIDSLIEESSNQLPDDTLQRTLRGNEQEGNPNDRDIVGNVDSNETPHGREEAKNDARSKANRNG